MEKTKNILFIIATIFFVSYVGFDVYNSFQPKTSIDLVNKLSNINLENYNEYAIELEEDYKTIQEFITNPPSRISQFTIIKSDKDILILETTPQIVDNRIKVTNVQKISEEKFHTKLKISAINCSAYFLEILGTSSIK